MASVAQAAHHISWLSLPSTTLSSASNLPSPCIQTKTPKPTIFQTSHAKRKATAFKNGNDNNSSMSSETGCPVPFDQQPINEYKNLSASFPFSWAAKDDILEYCSWLFFTGASFAVFVGLPVSSFGADSEPLKSVLCAVSSGVLVVIVLVVRMYLGWSYVGNRLLSATVEYEETGWYDGQIWVKTAEILARDRLLGTCTVKPVLTRLKDTLVVLGASLVLCILLLEKIEDGQQYFLTSSEENGGRAIPGVYNDESARSFEPDAFCGEPNLP